MSQETPGAMLIVLTRRDTPMKLGAMADVAARWISALLMLNRPSKWSVRVADRVNQTVYAVGGMKFFATSWLPLMRAQTALTKEPDTTEWIRGMSSASVFWDVGANVGVYTVFAASRGVRVFAFEPESSNFALLNRNIALNRLDARAYPLAVASSPGLDTLRLGDMRPGGALHSFGTNIDYRGQEFTPIYEQGSMAVTLDQLAYDFGLPVPDHIKIDVDGLEAQIVSGAERLLSEPKLKSLLIEINVALDQALIANMARHGFVIVMRGKQLLEEKVFNAVFARRHD